MWKRLLTQILGTLCLLISLAALTVAEAQTRSELTFPDLAGYVTLRCDLHMHSAFSDGGVWPTVRVEEAWRDGLDAIALSDHIEYLPHKNELPPDFGHGALLARKAGEPLGILVISAAEITRGEPPGHLNALFLTNVAALEQKDYRHAVSNAFLQGAFLFWNHPGWKQPDHKGVWYAEQGDFYDKGWLKGIEIVNGPDYDPVAHQWCLDKNLTMLGNSDAHAPTAFDYDRARGEMRPVTLVFAKSRSEEGVKEALLARRTAVLTPERLIGLAEYLEPLFQGSVEVLNAPVVIRGKQKAYLQVRNKAPLDFELQLAEKGGWELPEHVRLQSGKITLVPVRVLAPLGSLEQDIAFRCRIQNLLVAPEKGLRTELRWKLKYVPNN